MDFLTFLWWRPCRPDVFKAAVRPWGQGVGVCKQEALAYFLGSFENAVGEQPKKPDWLVVLSQTFYFQTWDFVHGARTGVIANQKRTLLGI